MLDPVSIRLAVTDDERRAAYQLRYRIFTRELGRNTLANHETEEYKDDFDGPKSTLLISVAGADVVGTLRLTARSVTPFWQDADYQLEQLRDLLSMAAPLPLEQIGLFDRGAVTKPYRGSGLYELMYTELEKYACSIGIRVLVGVIDSTNERLIEFHKRRGWVTYRHGIRFRDLSAHFIALDLVGDRSS